MRIVTIHMPDIGRSWVRFPYGACSNFWTAQPNQWVGCFNWASCPKRTAWRKKRTKKQKKNSVVIWDYLGQPGWLIGSYHPQFSIKYCLLQIKFTFGLSYLEFNKYAFIVMLHGAANLLPSWVLCGFFPQGSKRPLQHNEKKRKNEKKQTKNK